MAPAPTKPEAAVPATVRDVWVRRVVAVALLALTVCLFLPWTSSLAAPTIDTRPELVWGTVATIILGAVALAFPSRWTAYVAALPTTVALTDLGPVLWARGGDYSPVLTQVLLISTVLSVGWMVSAVIRSWDTPSSNQWVIAPIGILLTVASLGLPWFVVSEIGSESGPTTAWEIILGAPVGLPAGVSPTRIIIMLTLFVGIVAAVLPLAVRSRWAWSMAVICSLFAVVALLATELWVAARLDAIEPATGSAGQRVALAGLLLLGVVWSSPRASESDSTDAIELSPDPSSNLVA